MNLLHHHLFAMRRRPSKFHGMTFVAVTVILLLQMAVLVGLILFWRGSPEGNAEAKAEAEVFRETRADEIQPMVPEQAQADGDVEGIEEGAELLVPPVERIRPDWLTGRQPPETDPADGLELPED